MRAIRTTLGLAALALVLQACSTTYVGHKLPADGSQPAGDTGVPHTLTRHEFTLKIAADAEDATKPVFTLQRTSVPDPNQRYSLALAPGFLTDGTMTYNFGTTGNLSNTEASTTSQVVATIKSIAGFAANVIGAKTALKDETDVWTRFVARLTVRPPDPGNAAENGTPLDNCRKDVGQALTNYASTLADAAKKKFPAPDKDAVYKNTDAKAKAERDVLNQRAAWVADRFHYRNTAEQACLAAVRTSFQNAESDEADFKTAIAAVSASGTEQAVKDLKDLVAKKMEPGAVSSKLSALDDKDDPKLKNAYEKAQAYLTDVQSNKLAARLAQFYVDMPLDAWRARHLAQVESDIETARFALLVLLANPPAKNATQAIKEQHAKAVKEARDQLKPLEDQRDQLVDATGLKQRIAAIDALLNAGKTGHGEGRAQLSADRDRLQGLWDQARADLVAKNQTFDLAAKPKAEKVKPKDNEPVALVAQSYVDDVNSGKIKVDKDLPKFVVVMRRLPGATPIQALPAPAAASAAAAGK